MGHIYFPLRSNTGWFRDEATRRELERRIKQHLVVYDTLMFEDGTYRLVQLDNGDFDMHIPPASNPEPRDSLEYFTNGKFELRVGSGSGEFLPVLAGEPLAAYTVDWLPILKEAGLLGEPFAPLVDYSLTDEGKRTVNTAVQADRRQRELMSAIPGNTFQSKKVVQSIYHDSIIAYGLGVPFTSDALVGRFIAAKNRSVTSHWDLDLSPFLLECLATLALPDFADQPWDAVVAARQSAAGRELRTMIARLNAEVIESLPQLRTEADLYKLVSQLYIRELVEEVRDFVPGAGDAAVGLTLNLIPIPWFSIVGSVRDIAGYVAAKRSWISLLE